MAGDTAAGALSELRHWFEAMQAYVRAVDFDGARQIFDADVASFGTHADIVRGLDVLQQRQWSAVWPNITDFTFDIDALVGGATGDLAWAAASWNSTGFDHEGKPFPRPGRATVTFRRQNGRWLATHTHFSLNPGVPPRTYPRRPAAPTEGAA